MEKKGRTNISFFLLMTSTLFLFVSLSFSSQENIGTTSTSAGQNGRQTLEIIIGIGSSPPAYPPDNGGCPDCTPSPEPACSPPPPIPPSPKPLIPPKNVPPPPPPPLPSPQPTPREPVPPPQQVAPPPPPSLTPPRRLPPRPRPTPRSVLPTNLQMAIRVIKKFKERITYDPTHITKTWTGDKICYDKSTYKGFICHRRKEEEETKYRIVGVKFNGLHFDGQLAVKDFIERVSDDLVFFHANSNNLTGDIPFDIAKIPRFYELDLSNNKFTGAFPKPILAANFTILDLRFNKFTGPVPPQVFELDLDILFLNNNEFSGNIPENLGKLPVLYLTLASNKFTGPIPRSIGQASKNLLEVLFLRNQLSGCLPYEIGLLKRTTVFDASFNQLTGPIPQSFGCLESMQVMNMSNNQLYGAVPETLCMLGKLQKLQLKFNYFTRVGPECRKLIKEKVLDVSMNCISDLPSQRTPKQCEDFLSKRHSCPDAEHLKYVPCEIDHSRSQENRAKEVMAPSPSYAALSNAHAL